MLPLFNFRLHVLLVISNMREKFSMRDETNFIDDINDRMTVLDDPKKVTKCNRPES